MNENHIFLLFGSGIILISGITIATIISTAIKKRKASNKTSSQTAPQAETYPYQLNKKFLSFAETEFFHILTQATENKAVILTKVNLGDLFYVEHSQWRRYRSKIDRRHVDYLICNPKTLEPILGIELDDNSHNNTKSQKTDELKNNIFKAAGLPLLRIPVQHTYNTKKLQKSIIQTAKTKRDTTKVRPGSEVTPITR